jgi:TMEM175 potassium channel family protein
MPATSGAARQARAADSIARVDRSRFESFSDGVFAVAITLLALDLAVAGPGHGSLLSQLGHHWPSFAAYVISFFMIGIIWVNHHALVQNIAVFNRTLMFLNLLLLMFVVAIPFATSTMAAYLTGGGRDAEVAAALYALAFEAMGLSFAILFEWTLREDARLHQPLPADRRWEARLRFYGGQIVYIAAIGVAFVMPAAVLVMTAAVAVYYMTPVPHLGGHRGRENGRPEQDSQETSPTSRTLRRPAAAVRQPRRDTVSTCGLSRRCRVRCGLAWRQLWRSDR